MHGCHYFINFLLEKKICSFYSYRLDLPNSVILLLTGPSSAFGKVVRPWNVVAVFLSVEGMSGVGGWGGGGYERWMTPLVSGCGGGPKKII